MYLSICDKVIEQRQKEVLAENARFIEECNSTYEKLPFWKKLFTSYPEEEIRSQIMRNWMMFEIWQNQRMREQTRLNPPPSFY